MKIKNRFALFVITGCLLMSQASFAKKKECGDYSTTSDISGCFCTEAKKADTELNKVYQEVLKTYKKDPKGLAKIKAAEKAWIAFRDAYLESFYNVDEIGSANTLSTCQCQLETRLIQERIAQLKFFLDPDNSGDVCSPNWKTE